MVSGTRHLISFRASSTELSEPQLAPLPPEASNLKPTTSLTCSSQCILNNGNVHEFFGTPDAKFVYAVVDADTWYDQFLGLEYSRMQQIHHEMDMPHAASCFGHLPVFFHCSLISRNDTFAQNLKPQALHPRAPPNPTLN